MPAGLRRFLSGAADDIRQDFTHPKLVSCCIGTYQRLTGEPNQPLGVIIILLSGKHGEHDLSNYQSQLWQMADTQHGRGGVVGLLVERPT